MYVTPDNYLVVEVCKKLPLENLRYLLQTHNTISDVTLLQMYG